jgi:RNA-binding protein YlmH
MREDYTLEKKRFLELGRKSYNSGIYTFTDFLGLGEQSAFHEIERDIVGIPYTAFGGNEGCERVMIRFGSEDICGYEMPFPISIVLCQPLSDKFAEKLSHRDFLGAILNLGIDRSVLGDIAIVDNRAYIFVKEGMAEFVADSLTKVRKTSVKCNIVDSAPEGTLYNTKEIRVQAVGERIDALVAKVFSISRDDSATLFSRGLVFISGKCCESTSHKLKEGDIDSVRGYGRFIYRGVEGHTKKGKLNTLIEPYV